VPVLMELPDAQMEAASVAYHNPVRRP